MRFQATDIARGTGIENTIDSKTPTMESKEQAEMKSGGEKISTKKKKAHTSTNTCTKTYTGPTSRPAHEMAPP